jgi:hypothetical protein
LQNYYWNLTLIGLVVLKLSRFIQTITMVDPRHFTMFYPEQSGNWQALKHTLTPVPLALRRAESDRLRWEEIHHLIVGPHPGAVKIKQWRM